MEPDPRNQLSWSTAGSVSKNLPTLVDAHSKVFAQYKPTRVLEVASGFGDHILAYAKQHPDIIFQPTECDGYLVHQLTKAADDVHLSNVLPPKKLDVLREEDWNSLLDKEESAFDLITVTNLINVAPWAVTEGLFKAIGSSNPPVLTRSSGTLCMYAAMRINGAFQSEADEKFDEHLRARTPEFGLRNLEDIVKLAEQQGLQLASKEALGGGTNMFLQFRNA